MKKILLGASLMLAFFANSQPITDTAALRTRINADIVTNGSRAITAIQLNRILNGYLNTYPNTIINAASPLLWNPITRLLSIPGWNGSNWNSVYNWYLTTGINSVPGTRLITINGTTFDLSANRTWTIPTFYTNDGTFPAAANRLVNGSAGTFQMYNLQSFIITQNSVPGLFPRIKLDNTVGLVASPNALSNLQLFNDHYLLAFSQNIALGYLDSTSFSKRIVYTTNLGSLFNSRTLVDKGYVDSLFATFGGAGGGTVTSVSTSSPITGISFGVTSPTSTPALTWTAIASGGNKVFAGPTGAGGGTASFRLLAASDIPSLDANKITTGVFNQALIATGTASAGFVPVSDGSGGTAWTAQTGGGGGGTLTGANNGLSISGANVKLGGSTLSGLTSIGGGGNSLQLGTPGSHLNDLDLYLDGGLNLNGGLFLAPFTFSSNSDLSWGGSGNAYIILSTVLSANRTFTFPTATAGRIVWLFNKNSNSFHWNLSGTVTDDLGQAITQLPNGTLAYFIADGTGWIYKPGKYQIGPGLGTTADGTIFNDDHFKANYWRNSGTSGQPFYRPETDSSAYFRKLLITVNGSPADTSGSNDSTVVVNIVATGGGGGGTSASGFDSLTTVTASGAANVSFNLSSYPQYRGFEVRASGISAASNNARIFARTSTNGGSSFDASSTDYSYVYIYSSAGDNGADPADHIELNDVVPDASHGKFHMTFKISDPATASNVINMEWTIGGKNSFTTATNVRGNGWRYYSLGNDDVTNIRFFLRDNSNASDVNVSGRFTLYGLK